MDHPHNSSSVNSIQAIKWDNNSLILLDQRSLPGKVEYLKLERVEQVIDAIKNMAVRGAPAIGICAAYGFVLALSEVVKFSPDDWHPLLADKIQLLKNSRPTAVNLSWAIDRLQVVLQKNIENPMQAVLDEANTIYQEDINANLAMGEKGAAYLKECKGVLTHCNTGSLATGGYGTALGVIRSAFSRKMIESVYVSETRPWLQGSRLTAWELEQDDIPVTLITDSTAACLMKNGLVNWVLTGADRIASNGDVANKIGTYSHAINARHHGLGFMVVAPVSTIDLNTQDGTAIEIEERNPSELKEFSGQMIAPKNVKAFNPVFDITPADLVTVLVTELGVIESPNREKILSLLRRKNQ